MNNDWFVIKDLKEFINSSRLLVFNNFDLKTEDDTSVDNLLTKLNKQDQEELDQILSYKESVLIAKTFIKKKKNKKTKSIRYLINEDTYLKMINALNDRMVSNILNNLVNKGLIESAYDAESNDFIFWCVKNDNKDQQQKPETD